MTTRTPPFHNLDVDGALKTLVQLTASETGAQFFASLVKNLAEVLDVHGAWVTEYLPDERRLRALAFWLGNRWVDHYEYNIEGTPCEPVIDRCELLLVPDNVIELFPGDPDLPSMNAVSYMAVPLTGTDGKIIGHLAVLDQRPMPKETQAEALFRIFAARAGAELRRVRAEIGLREREEKLATLLNSAQDAIVDIDETLTVTHVNPAAREAFGCRSEEMIGSDFGRHLDDESRVRLKRLMRELTTRTDERRSTWIPGGFQAVAGDGRTFAAEATLSLYELHSKRYFTLILRNVNDRLEAEKQIEALTAQTEYLRKELDAVEGFGDIIGRSPALMRVLNDVKQVAETDATVLIHGETGTGKELIAHAIHTASRRADKPFVKVNCAAIPANLIESEFFGHEKGAFTGATSKREGRFTLADGGTIFLDEIGELPFELQSKLLRVLQEGQFEPVGSSRSQSVDVRVIAATNRDLRHESVQGRFREDLYYRLSVFPISVPALRDRIEDIPLLARSFCERFSKRNGRTVQPLSSECMRRLQTYHWPGNIRELQNVIERAIITSIDGHISLDRALPHIDTPTPPSDTKTDGDIHDRVLTVAELADLERRSIIRALEASGWRVSGTAGAAAILGMKPTTLSSRMKALKIERPK